MSPRWFHDAALHVLAVTRAGRVVRKPPPTAPAADLANSRRTLSIRGDYSDSRRAPQRGARRRVRVAGASSHSSVLAGRSACCRRRRGPRRYARDRRARHHPAPVRRPGRPRRGRSSRADARRGTRPRPSRTRHGSARAGRRAPGRLQSSATAAAVRTPRPPPGSRIRSASGGSCTSSRGSHEAGGAGRGEELARVRAAPGSGSAARRFARSGGSKSCCSRRCRTGPSTRQVHAGWRRNGPCRRWPDVRANGMPERVSWDQPVRRAWGEHVYTMVHAGRGVAPSRPTANVQAVPVAEPDGDGAGIQRSAAMDVPMQPEPARRLCSPPPSAARHCSPAAPDPARAKSAAGFWRTTGSKRLSLCPSRCSTTPASAPASGSSPTARRVAVGSISSKPAIRGRPATACTPPRPLEAIDADLKRAEEEIVRLPRNVVG